MLLPKSLAYSSRVQVGCLKWLTACTFSTWVVRQTSGLMENLGLNMSMFLSSLSRPFSNKLRDAAVFAAMVPCGPLVVLVIPLLDFTFSTVALQYKKKLSWPSGVLPWVYNSAGCCWCLWCTENARCSFPRFSKNSIVPARFVTSFIVPIWAVTISQIPDRQAKEIPHPVPQFWWVPLPGKQWNPGSRQDIYGFPDSRTIFWSNPGSRKYPSRPSITIYTDSIQVSENCEALQEFSALRENKMSNDKPLVSCCF